MTTEILLAGFGGQGVLFAGKILAYCGLMDSKELSWLPSYGPEMRGGTANCSVKFDDKAIASPFLKNVDILCAMNTPSVDSFQGELKPGAVMFVDSGVVPEDSLERKSNDELEDISKFVPDIPKPLENAIMNALNVNAADRIQTAKEFADALSGVSEVERNKVKQRQADAGKWSLKMKILAISAIVVCVAVIGVLVLNTTSIHNNEKFKADTIQLYGKTIAQAEKELKANNITLKVTDNNYDDELVGKLDENTIVSPNDVNVKAKAVSVVVFAGKRGNANADKYGNVQVPNLYGMKESKAKDLLNKYGLKYNRVLVENNSFVGNVFKQSLKANSKVKVGTKITITVGKKKVVHTTVPTTTSYSVPETENNDSYNNNSDNSNNNSYNNANNNANNNSNYNSNQQTPKNNVQSTKSAAKSNDSKHDDSNVVDVGGFLD